MPKDQKRTMNDSVGMRPVLVANHSVLCHDFARAHGRGWPSSIPIASTEIVLNIDRLLLFFNLTDPMQ